MDEAFFNKISIVIITRDAEVTLGKTLESVSAFSEVVIYDNGSQDQTEAIAKQFSNVRFFTGPFLGFGNTKNHAVTLATTDWVCSLDADECLTQCLIEEFQVFKPFSDKQVGQITRENFFYGKKLRYGGWGNDKLIRLFNRKAHQFSDSQVHESIVTHNDSLIVHFKSPIEHNAVYRLSQILQKIDRYSELYATNSDKTYPVFIIVLKALFAFMQSYFLRLGCLEGWRGLMVAVSNSNSVFFKYFKVWVKKNVDQ